MNPAQAEAQQSLIPCLHARGAIPLAPGYSWGHTLPPAERMPCALAYTGLWTVLNATGPVYLIFLASDEVRWAPA